jgi:hypothetical protein
VGGFKNKWVKMEELLSKLESLAGDIRRKISEISGPYNEKQYKIITLFFFIKSWRTFQSIRLLCSKKLSEDADILLRSLFEAVVNLKYISLDWQKRIELFIGYDYVQRQKLLDKLKTLGDPLADRILQSSPEVVREVLDEYSKLKDDYPNTLRWSGKSIEAMAKDVGLEKHYIIYRLLSDHVHPSPRATLKYFSESPTGIVLGPSPSDDDIVRHVHTTCVYFLIICDHANEIFSLECDVKIKEINEQLFVLGQARVEKDKGHGD